MKKIFFLMVSAFLLNVIESESLECIRRKYPTGTVCVCNETYCDNLDFKLPTEKNKILILSTSDAGLRFKENSMELGSDRFIIEDFQENISLNQKNPRFFSNSNAEVTIDRNKTFQEILGFGNAFTGAVAYNLNLLSPKLRSHIFTSYYSKNFGNAFNMLRIPIGGCDFDLAPWAYNESPERDLQLSNFTKLDSRDLEKIEQLNELIKVTGNSDIKYVGAAWSSPKWMKSNNQWTGFSSLLDEYYQTWADYHVKFLELMKEAGVDFWAISTGNEPQNGAAAFLFIKFMSLGWTPGAQGKWVGENLGPALKKSEKVSHVKILAGDDQRYTFSWWFDRMYKSSPKSKDFIAGHAVHWYWDKFTNPSLLEQTYLKYPDKLIIATEACSGDKPWEESKPVLGFWQRAEDYVVDIIEDLNHYVSAWIDWNMVLDEKGGPNYADNFVDTAVVINVTSKAEFYKQPIFYALGHFSRFITPSSFRLGSTSNNRNLHSLATLRPDGYTTVVLYNRASHKLNVDLKDSMLGLVKLELPPKSVHTLVYKQME